MLQDRIKEFRERNEFLIPIKTSNFVFLTFYLAKHIPLG